MTQHIFGCERNWELSTAGAATFCIACRGPQLTHHAQGTMPIKPENKVRYPKDWKQVRERILLRAGNRCEWPACNLLNYSRNPRTGSKVVLTIAHLDHTPENCADDNLRAWCQQHHLAYDHEHHQQNAYQTRRKGKAVDCFDNSGDEKHG